MGRVVVRNLRFHYDQCGPFFGYRLGKYLYSAVCLDAIFENPEFDYFPKLPTFIIDSDGSQIIAIVWSAYPFGGTVMMLYQYVNEQMVELTPRPRSFECYFYTIECLLVTKSKQKPSYENSLIEEPILKPVNPRILEQVKEIVDHGIITDDTYNQIIAIKI